VDDSMFPPADDTDDTPVGDSDISLPEMDEDKKEENKDESNPPEDKKEEKPEDKKEEPSDKKEDMPPEDKKETPPEDKKEENKDDDLDLSEIFKDLDTLNTEQDDLLKKAEESNWNLSPQEVAMLRKNNDAMQKIIERITNEKADLMFKNAELQAFGWNYSTPELLILSRNLPNVSKDENAKTKVVSILKNMYEDLVGKDIEQEKIDKEADILSAAESYNSTVNPDLKKKEENDMTIVLD